jgi:hypothetical protein
MSDLTGLWDRPEASPFNSAPLVINHTYTDHYWHHNPDTQKFELVKRMPAGTPDLVIREFDNFFELWTWTNMRWCKYGSFD